MDWNTDIEAAKAHKTHDGQVLVEVTDGYFQVVRWDGSAWRENTNHLRLRNDFKRWRAI